MLSYQILTNITYWLLIISWTTILVLYINRLYVSHNSKGFLNILLIILAIHAFSSLFESIFFGSRFTSLSGIIPNNFYIVLSRPGIVLIPKIINLTASILILFVIIRKWIPEAYKRIDKYNALLKQKTNELESSNRLLKLESVLARESEDKYNKATINSPFPIIIHAEDGEVMFINKAWTKISGYKLEEINTIPKWTEKAYGKKSIFVQEYIDKLYMLDTSTDDGEYTITTKSGEQRIWSFSSAPLETIADGRKTVISTAVDITNKKAIEQELKENNEYHQALFYESPIGLALANMDGQLIDVNQAYANIIGYSIEEVLKLTYWQITPKKYTQNENKQLEDLQTKGKYGPYEKEYIHSNGNLIPVRLQGKVIKRKGIKYIWSSVEDITEVRRTESQLMENQRKLSVLFNNLQGIAYRCINDNNWTMEFLSEGCMEITGYPVLDLLGNKILSYNDIILTDDQIMVKNKVKEAVDQHIPFEISYRIKTKTNKTKWVKEKGMGIFNNDNELIALEGFIWDISESKENNQKISELNKNLEARVKERTTALEQKTTELANTQSALLNIVEDLNDKSNLLERSANNLQNTNKELEAFAYSISHDLRAPLRAIDGFTQILIEDYVNNLDDEAKRIGTIIQTSSQRMGKLIDDLLAFSRIGRTTMNFAKIDMKYMANAIFHEVTNEIQREKITIKIDDLPQGNGDTNMMRQVWINLLSNAIKYSSNRKSSLISITYRIESNKCVYCIRDNGVGFNMKYKDKLFGVFQRLHTDKEFEGTGVGLALVQRIVHRHKGEVWADAEINKGANFYFSLPN